MFMLVGSWIGPLMAILRISSRWASVSWAEAIGAMAVTRRPTIRKIDQMGFDFMPVLRRCRCGGSGAWCEVCLLSCDWIAVTPGVELGQNLRRSRQVETWR